jgi:hypothetical protein
MPGRSSSAAAALAAMAWSLCGPSPAPAAAPPADYASAANWLCRPGQSGPCSGNLTATVIGAGGPPGRRTYSPDPDAPIDCFYVYPTVSREPTANSDLALGPEEIEVAKMQFARFGAKCRLYAPLYRQVTVAALIGKASGADTELAYRDVLAAWTRYLAHDNQGRGFVLIGHSQGSKILIRLIAEEIDGKPVERRLVSAIVPGAEIAVPDGGVVGGYFKHVPLCAKADEAGCVIGYSTYLAVRPPQADARFGADPAPGQKDACVDPAALLVHDALQPDFPAVGRLGELLGTNFIENPGLIHARCARGDGRTYLAVSVGGDGDIVAGRLEELADRRPAWGLHVLDINIALGDLVELVGRQWAAWTAREASPGK